MSDGHGGTATTTLTINVTGTNDQPAITGATTGAVVEAGTTPGTPTATGQLNSGDPDHGAQDTWTVVGGSAPHAADYVFAVDNLSIVKNGDPTPIFNDGFGNGIAPPNSPSFSNGNPHSYGTSGTFSETGGRTIMDGTLADPALGVGTPDEFVGHFATVRSNIDPNDMTLGLKSDDDFTVEGRFDLILPDDRREAYGIRLTDRLIGGTGPNVPPDQPGDDGLDLVVRMVNDGTVRVQLVEVDFANDQYNILGGVVLNPPAGVDQIVLRLSHDNANLGTITASFDLLDGGVLVGTTQTLSVQGKIFGTETPGFTGDDENWTRAQIVAYAPEELGSVHNGIYGSLAVNQAGAWTYALANNQANVQALAAGDIAYDTFQIQVTDEHGATDTETVTITVHGTNDAPTVSAQVAGTGSEGSGIFSVNLLDFASDVDHGAVINVANIVWDEVPGNLPFGFTVTGNTISVDTNELAYDLMAEGESFATHFTYQVVDEHGAAVIQHATITITGTNDAPVVAALSGDSAGTATPLPETNSGLTASGTLSVTDVDLTDTVAMTVHAVSATGPTGALTNVDLLGFFSVAPGSLDADGGTTNNLAWSFDSGSEAFDFLPDGQQLTLQYTVRATDDSGTGNNVDDGTVTIRIAGTNDGPVITGGNTTGSVQEDAINQAAGHLDALDLDNGAMLTWSAQGGTSSADADYLFSADSFTVTRENAVFFHDDFSDGNPPPTGPAFPFVNSVPYAGAGVNGLDEAAGPTDLR